MILTMDIHLKYAAAQLSNKWGPPLKMYGMIVQCFEFMKNQTRSLFPICPKVFLLHDALERYYRSV